MNLTKIIYQINPSHSTAPMDMGAFLNYGCHIKVPAFLFIQPSSLLSSSSCCIEMELLDENTTVYRQSTVG